MTLGLWEYVLKLARPRAKRAGEEPGVAARRVAKAGAGTRTPRRRATMGERYEATTREMLATHSIRVRKWRRSMSGVAYCLHYRDGRISRVIEAPRPKGPMSAAVFLHEVGHHAIGLGTYRPRCLEEFHAWMFALREMERRGIPITQGVRKRVGLSLRYAVGKARRRGLRELPEELVPYA